MEFEDNVAVLVFLFSLKSIELLHIWSSLHQDHYFRPQLGNVDLYYLFFIEIFIEEYQYFIIRPQQNATSDSIKIFLGGVPLTTNVHYDPVGLLELPETPSRDSCSLQFHQSVWLGSMVFGWCLWWGPYITYYMCKIPGGNTALSYTMLPRKKFPLTPGSLCLQFLLGRTALSMKVIWKWNSVLLCLEEIVNKASPVSGGTSFWVA